MSFFVVAVSLLYAGHSHAQTCIQDVAEQNLNCTSDDLLIAEVQVADPPEGCIIGDDITVDVTAVLWSQADVRYDVGIFVATDDGNAFEGECIRDFLSPVNQTPTIGDTRTEPFFNAEDEDDLCGDVEKEIFTLRVWENITVECKDTDSDGFADISSCFGWSNQQNQNPPCEDVTDTLPRNPAKCRCQTLNLDIPIAGKIVVIKEVLGGGDPDNPNQSFDFMASWDAGADPDFSLMDGEMFMSELDPGTYTVTEAGPPNWTTFATCDSGEDPTSEIDLDDGETVTCTFQNTFIDPDCPPCEDNIACTANDCDPDTLECINTPMHSICNDGEFCTGEELCDPTDNNADADGCVEGEAVVCDEDDIECTREECDEDANACVIIADDTLCDDDTLFCNGSEICDPGAGCLETLPPCGDLFSCTEDICDEESDACTNVPNEELCDDGIECTEDSCVDNETCENIPQDDLCDDDDPCTEDICDAVEGCTNEPIDDCPDEKKKRRHKHGGGSGFAPVLLPPVPFECPPPECLRVHNPDALDTDFDGVIDTCDTTPLFPNPGLEDLDDDGIPDACDNCPAVPNPDQLDVNANAIGDACEEPLALGSTVALNPIDAGVVVNEAPRAPLVKRKSAKDSGCSSVRTTDLSLIALLMVLSTRILLKRRRRCKVRA